MIRTITLGHVFNVLGADGKKVGELTLEKNTYSPRALAKILKESGYNSGEVAVFSHTLQEKRGMTETDFIKYSHLVEE